MLGLLPPLSESERSLYSDKGMKKFFNNYWIEEIFLIFLELLIFEAMFFLYLIADFSEIAALEMLMMLGRFFELACDEFLPIVPSVLSVATGFL